MTPGGEAVCTVTIRNSSAVVDSYEVTVLGDAASWTTVTPAAVSLFPGADGTAEIRFRPPRNSSLRAGATDFAVRVSSTQSDDSVVEEAVAHVEPFTEIAARITPRTSEAKRKAKHAVAIDNKGNAPVTVSVVAADPDEALAFQSSPPEVTIEPGESGVVAIGVAAHKGFARGPAQHRPFQATVTPSPAGYQPPIVLDANFVQKAGMPGFVPALVAAAVVLIAAVIVVPGLLKDDGKDLNSLLANSTGDTTTTIAAAAAEGGEDGDAEAVATEGAGAAAGGETGGEQSEGGGGEGTPTTVASAGGGGAKPAVTTTVAPSEDEPTATTAPDAAPVTSTTVPQSTTTTAPPAYKGFVGSWVASGSCIAMSTDDRTMFVTVKTSSGSFSGTAGATDANDGDFTVVYKAQNVQQQYQLLSSTTMRVTTQQIGSFTRPTVVDHAKVRSC